MAKNTYGGIRFSDLHQFNAKFVCTSCSLLLYRPYQLSCCGALICEGCRADEQPFICSNCKMEQPTRQAILDRAVDREMKTLHVGCFNCKWTGTYEDYLKHLENKHKDFQCEQCQERFFSRNSYRQHQLETCEHRRLSCGLPNCETSIKHSEMHKHYLSTTHQNILNKTILKSRHRKRTDYRSIREMHGKAVSILDIINNENARIKTEFGRERTDFDKNKSEIDQLKIVQKQTNEQFQNLFNNFTNMQTQMQQIKQSDILTLDSNASMIISYVYPMNAKLSTFQTSGYGYRFSVRLSTTIIQQNEFLSFTVNLLNGDYNNILPFPFTYNIHFILCDQSSKHEDFCYILKPDRHLSALARPTSERNEDISILDFCPMEKLTSKYVQDGKFFLRIFVDFLNSI